MASCTFDSRRRHYPVIPVKSYAPIDFANLKDDCRALAFQKYGDPMSAYMSARVRGEYFSPEDHYEALLKRIVTVDSSWLDVGCGCSPFPNNPRLSAELSERCRTLVGIDPDPSVNKNRFVHERHHLSLERFCPAAAFDLVTARMVVEHVENPREFVGAIFRVTKPGSLLVLFTVNWWSLTTLAARFSPMWLHHWLKGGLWNTDPKDTFRTEYKMNRRAKLQSLMREISFTECFFEVLPDASLFWRVPFVRYLELTGYKMTRQLGLPYFDTCILAVYQRND